MFSVLLDQFFMSVTTFATTIILARTYDVLVYADFVLLITLTVFVLGLQSALISKPYAINLNDYKDSKRSIDYFQFALNSKLIFTVIILLLFPIIYFFSFKEWNSLDVLIFSFFIISYSSYYFVRELLLSERRTRQNMIYGLLCSGFLIVLLGYIWFFNVSDIFVYLVSASTIYFGLSLVYYVKNYRFIKYTFSNQVHFWKANWHVGKWLVGGNFLFHISSNIYPWLLLFIVDKKDVAVLGVLLSIGSIISPLLKAFGSYLLPLFVRLNTDFNKVSDLVKQCFWFFGMMSIIVLATGFLFGENLMNLFFGEKYANLGLLVIFPFIIQSVIIFFQPIKIALTAIKRTDVDFWVYIPRSIIAVVLGYFMVSSYGIYGVFYTMIIENLFYQTIQFYIYTKIILKNKNFENL